MKLRHLAPLVCLLALSGSLATSAQAARQQPRVVVSPRPGERIDVHTVRIVVRAGHLRGDVVANLNGVGIGTEFRPGKRGRQVVRASATHGLRFGRNVLRVTAYRGSVVRHATVVFRVGHRHPLTGAGRERRATPGSRVRLRGVVKLHPSSSATPRLRWRVIDAPRRSRLSRGGASGSASGGAGLRRPRSMRPLLVPDVIGSYRLKLTASTPRGSNSDIVEVSVGEADPLVVLRTAVTGGKADPRPGIRVGGTVYRAPWMKLTATNGWYSGVAGGVPFEALWQVLLLDRKTLDLISNRTYGICTDGTEYLCRNGEAAPVAANLGKELQGTRDTIAIVRSHPPQGGETGGWAAPNRGGLAFARLGPMGLPSGKDTAFVAELSNAAPGSFSAVGLPGLPGVDASLAVRGDGAGMSGYLTPSPATRLSYGYVAATREPFDTRAEPSCDSDRCTFAIAVGPNRVTGSIERGKSGFVLAAFDRQSLAPLETMSRATSSDESYISESDESLRELTYFLERWGADGALIVVSSAHGGQQSQPLLFDRGVTKQRWNEFAQAVAATGGSRNRLNRAASDPQGADYTLLGWGGAGPYAGADLQAGSGRLRGALIPNNRSLYIPVGVSSTAAPNERLAQLTMEETSDAWPLDGEKAAHAALEWIGRQNSKLGPNPRAQYWSVVTQSEADALENEVEKTSFAEAPPSAGFDKSDFEKARRQLALELRYVGNVRSYMSKLASPAGKQAKEAWKEATKLQDELEERLNKLEAEDKVEFEFFAAIEGLLEIVTLGVGKDLEAFVTAAAVAAEMGQVLYGYEYGGGPEGGTRIEADAIGTELEKSAELSYGSFRRMGDILVADWSKLAEVGRWGACKPELCAPGYEAYAWNESMQEAAEASSQRGLEREIHEKLLTETFPTWETGLYKETSIEWFNCSDGWNPFQYVPKQAYYKSLDVVDPANPGGAGSELNTWLSVHRDRLTYGGAPESVLTKMFSAPTESNPGYLGIPIDAYMFRSHQADPYLPSPQCGWYQAEEGEG